MNTEERSHLFDRWAARYDESVRSTDVFPFDGYDRVLDRIVELSSVQPGMLILDLGTGTGNLAERFVTLGCTVWGVDSSSKMLAEARAKLPQARFIKADLMNDWPAALNQRFDRIVSAYVLHEFDLFTKVGLLERLTRNHLAERGCIVIGDIAFPNAQARAQAHKRWARLWDEEEHYWAADEAIEACTSAGLHLTYKQISSCGGVFVITPAPPI